MSLRKARERSGKSKEKNYISEIGLYARFLLGSVLLIRFISSNISLKSKGKNISLTVSVSVCS